MDLKYNINENGKILVWVISQTFPLGNADQKDKWKFKEEDKHGYPRDIDYKKLKQFFDDEKSKFPAKVKFELKDNISFEEFDAELKKLDSNSENLNELEYQCFIFVFLTYSKPVYDGEFDEEKLHFNHTTLVKGLVPQVEIIDKVKNLEVTKGKPKIFLIQADDLSLLEEKKDVLKGDPIKEQPIKIPKDVDQLIIKSTIPQRPHKVETSADQQQKEPSLLIQAFLKAMSKRDKTDIFTLTTDINAHVKEMLEKSGRKRRDEMNVPLVTSTLTKLIYL